MYRNMSFILCSCIILVFASCKKEYFRDTGTHKGVFAGNSVQYLGTNPLLFDTIAYVVNKSGLEEVLTKDQVTFFVPTDRAIKQAMDMLNDYRFTIGKDSAQMSNIPAVVWRKFLSRYIIRGKYMARDFARRDELKLEAFPGQFFETLDGFVMNIGLIYSSYGGVDAVGPRTLRLTYIYDLAEPTRGRVLSDVASSDLQTDNGVVHVLMDGHFFGFDTKDFIETAELYLN
ncbi:fasciclin domain-containing protein [Chitinophaga defluvii]|uniref:Fasciclin domain-containing protein n=1 Tax=Chitinophaga defluvii TaxID=3163343 RepID=A0ABV2T7A8_9BACT